MKHTNLSVLVVTTTLLLSQQARGQASTVEYQTNAAIEVQTGADVSADNIITNSNYSGGGTFNGAPLPVQMAKFIAEGGVRGAELRWRSETEVDNYGFEVERKSVASYGLRVPSPQPETRNPEPGTTWSKIGFVKGSGTSTSPKEYAYVDRSLPAGRYAYRIKQIDNSGAFIYTEAMEVEVGLAPREFTLGQNYPNPFNPTTTIEFTLPEDGRVRLKVYDIAGRAIGTLVDEVRTAGIYHQVAFDASHLGSGTYFFTVEFGGKQLTRKMMLVK